MIPAARRDGEPDVRDHARPRRVEDFLDAARRDAPEVAISAGPVVARLLQRLVLKSPRIARQESRFALGAVVLIAARLPRPATILRCNDSRSGTRCRHT